MASPILDDLTAEVDSTVGVMQSATVFIEGSTKRLEDAVRKALDNGATGEELAPVTAEIAAMKAAKDNLAGAIAANPTA